jgi:hypothetical protein
MPDPASPKVPLLWCTQPKTISGIEAEPIVNVSTARSPQVNERSP